MVLIKLGHQKVAADVSCLPSVVKKCQLIFSEICCILQTPKIYMDAKNIVELGKENAQSELTFR